MRIASSPGSFVPRDSMKGAASRLLGAGAIQYVENWFVTSSAACRSGSLTLPTNNDKIRSMAGGFDDLMSLALDEEKLLILTHHNPDPDTIASAAALRYLLAERRGIEATVAYSGVIGRAENRAMVEILDLPMMHLSEIDLTRWRHIALIDAQPHTGNNALPADRAATIVIDHHPLREATKQSSFYDVRPELGASATLLTEYLRLAELTIPSDLATALLYGIRSETQDLGREASAEDLRAYHELVARADPTKLAAITRPTLPQSYFTQLSLALDALRVGQTVTVCSPGEVSDPDFVSEMADLIVRMKGIRWSLVYGTFERRLYLSIRTNEIEANAGELMRDILEGIGKGGGHGMRGGGNIDVEGVSETSEELARVIEERFLRGTGATAERLAPLKSQHHGAIEATIHPFFG